MEFQLFEYDINISSIHPILINFFLELLHSYF